MARKIILFLSEYKGNAQEKSYRCPVGKDIAGTQTNEAPVKYLLRQYGNVEEILCIVTSKAKETAWLPFQDMIARTAQDVALTEIPYEEGDDFTDGPLTGIMEKVQAEDEVLLETTGGFRNAVMDLLLLSRILSYKKSTLGIDMPPTEILRNTRRTTPNCSRRITAHLACPLLMPKCSARSS